MYLNNVNVLYLIYHLQFTQERVDEPNSVGKIAYPPRIIFEFTLTSTAKTISTPIYIFKVLGMSTELNFPCRLRPTQSMSGGMHLYYFIMHSTYYT